MATTDVLAPIRYVVDANGERTDIVIPVTTWQKMLATWKEVVELQEDEEYSVILQDWLQRRASGAAETVPLDVLERELLADGLLPG